MRFDWRNLSPEAKEARKRYYADHSKRLADCVVSTGIIPRFNATDEGVIRFYERVSNKLKNVHK